MNALPPLAFALLVLAHGAACGGEPPPSQETRAPAPAEVDGTPERPVPRFVARRELAAPGKP
ncbi:MAG TPA: hypothetical protein VMS76_20325, partial [Planctomycetota bacterium]|nr:hypothetical protein [Planctomycetota bacterium]